MKSPKLSICIPTYNREAFLRFLLTHFLDECWRDFSFEIVISDNASTDRTEETVKEFIKQGLPIRYFRRAINGGSSANLASAFRHAIGEYSIYLADDDLLIADGVRAAMRYLDSNPDVIACYAPWTLYDAVNGIDLQKFFELEADFKFARQSFAEVFQFIVSRHIFPEIAIYRTQALRAAWVPREFCFWAFSYLAHFVDQGDVAFLQQPFYRSVAVSSVAQARQQAGHEGAMTGWDQYRGGLEYFLHFGEKRGKIELTQTKRLAFSELCKHFILQRMAVAVRLWAERKDFVKVYELYTRMAVGGMADHPEVVNLRGSLALLVALQTLAWHAGAIAGVTRLVLSGTRNAPSLEELLRELGLPSHIKVVEKPNNNDQEQAENTVVFIADEGEREKFLALGYPPNFIFSEGELLRAVLV